MIPLWANASAESKTDRSFDETTYEIADTKSNVTSPYDRIESRWTRRSIISLATQ